MSMFTRAAAPFLLVALVAGCDAPAAAVAALSDARLESDGGCIDLAPGVTIEQAPEQTDPTRTQPIRFAVTFEVPVVGFDASDVVLGGAGKGATAMVTANGDRSYTVEVSNLQRAGNVTAKIPSSAASAPGLCNNLTAASTSSDNEVRFVGKRSSP